MLKFICIGTCKIFVSKLIFNNNSKIILKYIGRVLYGYDKLLTKLIHPYIQNYIEFFKTIF